MDQVLPIRLQTGNRGIDYPLVVKPVHQEVEDIGILIQQLNGRVIAVLMLTQDVRKIRGS
jgi:hypothetical protein